MRLQIYSDLHLERIPHWEPTPAPGADVLVLAGDIGSYQTGSLLTEPDFGLTRFSPVRGAGHWKHVLFVPGNHEYDGFELSETGERLQALCARLGITWLDQRRVGYRALPAGRAAGAGAAAVLHAGCRCLRRLSAAAPAGSAGAGVRWLRGAVVLAEGG